MPMYGTEFLYDIPERGADELMRRLSRVVPTDPKVPHEHRLLAGDAAETIVALADAEKVDAIVIGTHGRDRDARSARAHSPVNGKRGGGGRAPGALPSARRKTAGSGRSEIAALESWVTNENGRAPSCTITTNPHTASDRDHSNSQN